MRQSYLDYARGVSIILVVFFHSSIALGAYGLVDPAYWIINNFMAPIRMPVFFFVSGFLASNALKINDERKISVKLINTFYLFSVWTVIHFVWQLVYQKNHGLKFFDLITYFYSPSSVLWFMWALSAYLIYARFFYTMRKTAFFLFSIILSILACSKIINFDSYVFNNVLTYLPIFLTGAWYSGGVLNFRYIRNKAFLIFFIVSYRGLLSENWAGFLRFFIMYLGITIGISASIMMCRYEKFSSVPLFIGRNTLAIYVAHSPIAYALTDGISFFTKDSFTIGLIAVPTVSVLSIFLSLWLNFLLKKVGFNWLYAAPPFLSNLKISILKFRNSP